MIYDIDVRWYIWHGMELALVQDIIACMYGLFGRKVCIAS